MFCGNCGNQIPDDSTFCPHCGQKIEHNTYGETQPIQVNYNQPRGTRSKTKKIPLISALIAVIAIVGVLFAVLGSGNSPEKVSEEFVKAYYDLDMEKTFDLSAFDVKYEDIKDLITTVLETQFSSYSGYMSEESLEDYLLEQYGTSDMGEVVEKVLDQVAEATLDNLIDTYGENIKITCKASKKTDLSKTRIRSMIDEINSSLDSARKSYPGKSSDLAVLDDMHIEAGSISEACEVIVDAQIKGDDDSGEKQYTIYLAKVNGKWKVLKSDDLSTGLF